MVKASNVIAATVTITQARETVTTVLPQISTKTVLKTVVIPSYSVVSQTQTKTTTVVTTSTSFSFVYSTVVASSTLYIPAITTVKTTTYTDYIPTTVTVLGTPTTQVVS